MYSYASTTSVALVGGEVYPVVVEAHVGSPKDVFKLSGLPDTALREAKDRVRAAILSSGITFPNRILTVNLAPAHLPKHGSDFDLAIAVGILAADNQIPQPRDVVLAGELALDGKVRKTSGSLGAAVLSARRGIPCLVAKDSAPLVARVPDSTVHGVETLAEAVSLLSGGLATATPVKADEAQEVEHAADLSEVRGQGVAKRALEIAAAGGHHLFLYGPPGGGKTMMAKRLPGILPSLEDAVATEVALIRSSLGIETSISRVPPFRAPHHSATRAALVGGGSRIPTVGEISLAHGGVLFLDELAEFPRANLDAMRQPLEEGRVVISRQGFSIEFPGRFQLVAASNPCPCGFHGDNRRPCQCTELGRLRYRQRVSGPLLDRFDLSVRVRRVDASEFKSQASESSSAVRERVLEARALQFERASLNRDLFGDSLDMAAMAATSSPLLYSALESGSITARGAAKVRRVARTIADLEGSAVSEDHVAEAISLRATW